MRKQLRLVPVALLALFALAGPLSAADVNGTWAIHPGDSANRPQLTLETSRAGDGHGHFQTSQPFDLAELRGLTPAQMASSAGTMVHFEIAREAGSFRCDGYFKQGQGAGTFVFHPNPGYASTMQSLGISGVDEDRQLSMALENVTTQYVRDIRAAGVQVQSAKQLIELRIFKVTPEYVHGLHSLGYSITDPHQLTKLRIFHVTTDTIRGFRQAGYQPTAEQLVKMSIFKVTPDFIAQIKKLGYSDVPVEDLVKMRIFKVDADYIRAMQSRGLKDLTIEKLVRLKIAGID
jgi:hypothetical protein